MKTTAAVALCLALSLTGAAVRAQPIVVIHPKWSPLGPTLINNGQAWPGRIPVTGRINVVAPNPKNRLGDVWIGSATGGVWHGSVHPQSFWEPMTDDQASLAVGAIRLDSCTAVRCQTVWVGTGENGIRRDTQHGMGVLRGRWNGSRYEWKLLGESHFARGSITGLVLDPSTPDSSGKRLFVALSSGVTSNASHSTVTTTPAGAYGIWRSDDAGQTWVNVLAQNTPATDLEIDPQNPQILFAGLRRKGIYRSTNGGASWQPVHNGIPANVAAAADWPEIAVHRTPGMAQATLYAVLGACPHPHEKGTPSRCSPAVYKSTNGGTNWNQVFAEGSPSTTYGEPLTTYTSYTHALTIHPTKPDTLWFGGINLYKSTNGGVSWTKVGNKSLHPDHHQIVVWESGDTATGDLAYDVNDGGFFVGDGENVWNGSYQAGLEITQFQSISTSGLVEHIIGGTQDNGTNVYQGSDVWEHVNDGDAASTNMDLDTGLNLYDVYVGAEPRRCKQASFCKYQWPNILSGITVTNNVSWYPPFVQDGNAVSGQHPLFFATNHLYRSTNDGTSWTAVTTGSPLGGTGTIAELGGIQNPISAVAVAPSDSNRIYLGYYDGQVFTTANGKSANPAWTKVDGNGLPDRPVTSIAVHPADPLRAFAAFTGFAQHSVYSTSQAGASWAPFDDENGTGVFAKNPVNVVHIEAKPPHRMWAGTDDGVYSRKGPDAGELWSRTSPNLPRVAVYDFDVSADGKRIYAATHGRGVWTMSTSPIPKIYAAECCGPVDLYDPAPFISIYIAALEPDQRCTLALLERDRVCSEGRLDADGATLTTNARGFLVASKRGHYAERPLSWACYEGRCAGGVPLSRCDVTDVRVTCGEQSVQAAVKRPVEAADPPSTQLGFLSIAGGAGSGSFILSPMLKRNGGKSEVLCASQAVSFSAYESEERVLARAAEAVNGNARCRDAGVRAAVFGSLSPGTREDEGPTPLRLVLEGPRLTGVQLVTELAASGPGAFTVDGYGVPLRDTLVVPRLTLSGTARGGDLRVTERSSLGACAFTVRTEPGERAEAVAAKVQRAFLAEEGKPGKPKPRWIAKLKSLFHSEKGKPTGFRIDPGCLNRQNPRDVSRYGATLRFPLGQELAVSNTDAGLSFTIGSDR